MRIDDRVNISTDHKKTLELMDSEGMFIVVQKTDTSEFNPCGMCSVVFNKIEIEKLKEYIKKHYQ